MDKILKNKLVKYFEAIKSFNQKRAESEVKLLELAKELEPIFAKNEEDKHYDKVSEFYILFSERFTADSELHPLIYKLSLTNDILEEAGISMEDLDIDLNIVKELSQMGADSPFSNNKNLFTEDMLKEKKEVILTIVKQVVNEAIRT